MARPAGKLAKRGPREKARNAGLSARFRCVGMALAPRKAGERAPDWRPPGARHGGFMGYVRPLSKFYASYDEHHKVAKSHRLADMSAEAERRKVLARGEMWRGLLPDNLKAEWRVSENAAVREAEWAFHRLLWCGTIGALGALERDV